VQGKWEWSLPVAWTLHRGSREVQKGSRLLAPPSRRPSPRQFPNSRDSSWRASCIAWSSLGSAGSNLRRMREFVLFVLLKSSRVVPSSIGVLVVAVVVVIQGCVYKKEHHARGCWPYLVSWKSRVIFAPFTCTVGPMLGTRQRKRFLQSFRSFYICKPPLAPTEYNSSIESFLPIGNSALAAMRKLVILDKRLWILQPW